MQPTQPEQANKFKPHEKHEVGPTSTSKSTHLNESQFVNKVAKCHAKKRMSQRHIGSSWAKNGLTE